MQKHQKKHKQTVEELEFITSSIPDLVMRIDKLGRVTFINAASVVFFSKTPDLLIGKLIETVIREENLTPLNQSLLQRVFETHQAEIVEGEIHSTNGIKKNVEIRVLPEPDGLSKEPHLVLLIRDVTVKKETERKLIQAKLKAEESDALKSAFLANMSHEIRTPLNAIVGFSQIILDENLNPEEQKQFFGYIQQNSDQLLGLVNDIIDLSKLESNQLVIHESLADLNQIVNEMKEIAENEKRNREKEHLLLFVDKGLPDDELLIIVDHFRLKQLLTNLLVNAIKFTPKGYIQFGYRLKDNQNLLFFVRDTGIGIPPNKQEEVFHYFHQLDNSLNRANTGTGLGLAICKRLVELMGGNIWLQSEPGKGTTFFFTIPYQKA